MSRPIGFALALLEYEGRPYNVVQIGAYVGNTANDPLYELFTNGGLQFGKLHAIEPIRDYYQQLRENYNGNHHVTCYNCAIGRELCFMLMSSVDPEAIRTHGKPKWLEQIASLQPNRLTDLWDQHETKEHEASLQEWCVQHTTSEPIQSLTLNSFMTAAGLESIDLLVIDAEGSEPDILPQIDFPVRFLQYEHVLMPIDYRAWLHDHGWITLKLGVDTFAWHEGDVVFTALIEEIA